MRVLSSRAAVMLPMHRRIQLSEQSAKFLADTKDLRTGLCTRLGRQLPQVVPKAPDLFPDMVPAHRRFL